MYQSEIALIKRDLGIEALPIKWVFKNSRRLKAKWAGLHSYTFDSIAVYDHQITVALSGYSYKEVVSTIAHELRHAWQFSTGVCVPKKDKFYDWRGSQFCGSAPNFKRTSKNYHQRPWEKDAKAYENEAWDRLFAADAPLVKRYTKTSSLALMFSDAIAARS